MTYEAVVQCGTLTTELSPEGGKGKKARVKWTSHSHLTFGSQNDLLASRERQLFLPLARETVHSLGHNMVRLPRHPALLFWNNSSHQYQLPNHFLSPLVKQYQSSIPTPQSSPLSSSETIPVINTNSPIISSLLFWNNTSHQYQLPNHLLSPLLKQHLSSIPTPQSSPLVKQQHQSSTPTPQSSPLLKQHQSSTPTPQSSPLSSSETTVNLSHQYQLHHHPSHSFWNNSQHQSSIPTPPSPSSPLLKQQSTSVINTNSTITQFSSSETTVNISHQYQLHHHPALLFWNNSQHQSSIPTPRSPSSPILKQQSTSVINTNSTVTQLSSSETTVNISHQYQLHGHPALLFWNNSQHQSSIPTPRSPSSPLLKQQSTSVINTNSTVTQFSYSETTVNISHQYQLHHHPVLLFWNNSQHQSSIPTPRSPSSPLLKQQSTSVINTNSTITQLSSSETTVNISHQYQLHGHPVLLFWNNSQHQSSIPTPPSPSSPILKQQSTSVINTNSTMLTDCELEKGRSQQECSYATVHVLSLVDSRTFGQSQQQLQL